MKRQTYAHLVFISITLAAATGFAEEPAANFKETSLATLSSGGTVPRSGFHLARDVIFSTDGRHFLFNSMNKQMIYDGVAGAAYDFADQAKLTDDGLHYAYAAKKGEENVLVSDGAEIAKSKEGFAGIYFDPKNKLAYVIRHPRNANKDELFSVVYNGTAGPIGTHVDALFFSPDGKRIAYGMNIDGKTAMMLDHKKHNEYNRIGGVLFWSPDSTLVAYGARTNDTAGDQRVVVVDPTGTKEIKQIISEVAFSPDGKHLARITSKGLRMPWCVVVDDKEMKEYLRILSVPIYSPDSKHLAYIADVTPAPDPAANPGGGRRGGGLSVANREVTMVVDEKAGPSYKEIKHPTFSPDSSHFAYMASAGDGKQLMILDGKVVGEGARGQPFFSRDSKRMAFWQSFVGGKNAVVIDGKPGPQLGSNNGEVVFSPDGQHVAYADYVYGKEAHGVVYLDEKPLVSTSMIFGAPVFSPDSKHLAYVTKNGLGKQLLYVDGKVSAEYDFIATGMQFDQDNSLEILAIREKTVYRVKYKP